MRNEFDETEQTDLRKDVRVFLNPGAVPQALDEKQDTADTLRLKHVMQRPSDQVSKDDQEFLRELLRQAALRGDF